MLVMRPNLLELAVNAKAVNSKLFSLPRVLIMSALEELRGESATFRELKIGLGLNDGVLYANLKVLGKMGYIEEKGVRLGNEEMTSYRITRHGLEDFAALRAWLERWGGGHGKPE